MTGPLRAWIGAIVDAKNMLLVRSVEVGRSDLRLVVRSVQAGRSGRSPLEIDGSVEYLPEAVQRSTRAAARVIREPVRRGSRKASRRNWSCRRRAQICIQAKNRWHRCKLFGCDPASGAGNEPERRGDHRDLAGPCGHGRSSTRMSQPPRSSESTSSEPDQTERVVQEVGTSHERNQTLSTAIGSVPCRS
jgi:hypothetical protein